MDPSAISHGPYWGVLVLFVIFAALSIVLLTGHGSGLIAGYNTASDADKSKYDEKKMCRVMGAGMALIALLILVMVLLGDNLPSGFAWLMLGVVFADIAGMLLALNLFCKK